MAVEPGAYPGAAGSCRPRAENASEQVPGGQGIPCGRSTPGGPAGWASRCPADTGTPIRKRSTATRPPRTAGAHGGRAGADGDRIRLGEQVLPRRGRAPRVRAGTRRARRAPCRGRRPATTPRRAGRVGRPWPRAGPNSASVAARSAASAVNGGRPGGADSRRDGRRWVGGGWSRCRGRGGRRHGAGGRARVGVTLRSVRRGCSGGRRRSRRARRRRTVPDRAAVGAGAGAGGSRRAVRTKAASGSRRRRGAGGRCARGRGRRR